MTSVESAKPSASLKSKIKEKERKSKSSQKGNNERLKTVVRRLPPNLPEQVFWQSVQQWVSEDTVTWKHYYPGKFRNRLNKESLSSRAYIAFKNDETLATFSREYDGHIFRDKAGNESMAVVEFSPFHKVPPEKKKLDARVNTIDKDEDYISFLESLKEPQTKPFDADILETLVASSQPAPMPTTTPLLEALKAEKSAQKDKEAILRNHAHYKDVGNNSGHAGASKKDEPKKKGGAHPLPAKPTDAQPSKKASKKEKAALAAAAAASAPKTILSPASNQSGVGAGSGSAPKNNPSAPATLPSKPPPSSGGSKRAQRERAASRNAANAASSSGANANASTSTPAPATAPTSTSSNAATSTSGTTAGGSETPAVAQAPRRARPVIGLASRQFEAALSGAVGGERRSRREKEKDGGEKEKRLEPGSAVDSPASPIEPKSPKRNRGPHAPTILQRDGYVQPPIILARPAQRAVSGESTDGGAGRGEGSGGGGRGGRGRGRGRGRGGRGG